MSTILRAPEAARRDGCSSVTRGRVLVVANRLPYPLDDGWKRRTFHVLRAIAAVRPVTLATLHAGGAQEVAALRDAIGNGLDVVTVTTSRWTMPRALALGIVTRLPYHVWKLRSKLLAREIERLAATQRFDIAIATMAHLFPYIQGLQPATLRVIDTHNIDSLVMTRYAGRMSGLLRRAYARATAARLRTHEAEVFAAADRVWVCSQEEVHAVAERASGARVRVIPNGVDAQGEFEPRAVTVQPRRILFFGRLDYYPNADGVAYFAETMLPRILERVPDAEFCVVGPGATRSLRTLLARTSCRLLGAVDELAETVSSAAVVVVPLRVGGGTRLKILEALALGKAVVSTPVGAEGLALRSGQHLSLAAAPDEFARAVVELLEDPGEATRLGAEGRDNVLRTYDWKLIEEQIRSELNLTVRPTP
ncbi:MAG: glycosyltransferase family 4 protein [Longimicrobiales bacterium]